MSVTTARPEPAVASAAAGTSRRRRRRRGSGMDRKPRFAVAVTIAFFVLLYLPIAAVVVFSFNTRKSLTVFDGWAVRWYDAFVHDSELTHSLGTSLEVAAVSMVGSVVIGTALAFGLVRARTRLG